MGVGLAFAAFQEEGGALLAPDESWERKFQRLQTSQGQPSGSSGSVQPLPGLSGPT